MVADAIRCVASDEVPGAGSAGVFPHHPCLGRFLAVDPLEGGRPNGYVHVTDPINQDDLTGMWFRVSIEHALGHTRNVVNTALGLAKFGKSAAGKPWREIRFARNFATGVMAVGTTALGEDRSVSIEDDA